MGTTAIKTQIASVRFDSDEGEWAVINPSSGNPTRHFTHGLMSNVKFSTQKVMDGMVGCGPAEFIGIATGELTEDTYGEEVEGFHNLAFRDNQFVGSDGQAVERCESLRLLTGRRALYR